MNVELLGWHYYECHITIAPTEDHAAVENIGKNYGFRMAKLLMEKDGRLAPHNKDMFFSARSKSLLDIKTRMLDFLEMLQNYCEIPVYRYKIESTLIDSREDMFLMKIAGEPE